MPLPAHILSPHDLLTSAADIVRGFTAQARLKRRLANPMVQKASSFLHSLTQAAGVETILQNANLQPELLTAAGFSQKAINNLDATTIQKEAHGFVNSVQNANVISWRQEIAFRYLLTMGDTLGGQSRNAVGEHAKNKLARLILNAAQVHFPNQVQVARKKKAKSIKVIVWPNRVLLFDRKSPLIKKNVDAILLDSTQGALPALLGNAQAYVCCGELKGGIDPAGADEHWKTAMSALARIKSQHAHNARLFYVGAVIDGTLSTDMYDQMENGVLDYAANLHSQPQLQALFNWLFGL